MTWRRPPACGGNGECIEVMRDDLGRILIQRDPDMLAAEPAEFAAFIAAAKNGEYDDLTEGTTP